MLEGRLYDNDDDSDAVYGVCVDVRLLHLKLAGVASFVFLYIVLICLSSRSVS